MYRWQGSNEERLVSPVELGEDFFDVEESFAKDFLIYDKRLEGVHGDFIKSFQFHMGFEGGETLKSFSLFAENVENILDQWPTLERDSILYVLGGGSLGDFGGFLASILKRGIHLIQIPSTWLSALDSSHGGKNALNSKGAKNQLGTFYPAQEVWLIKKVLDSLPAKLREQSLGEFVKMSLLHPGEFFDSFSESYDGSLDWYWSYLGKLINKKLELVGEDPFELMGPRLKLNLGHTMGHILETHFGLAHGDAVFQGLFFSLEMSYAKGHLSQKRKSFLEDSFVNRFKVSCLLNQPDFRPLNVSQFEKTLGMDKKNVSSKTNYVFISENDGAFAQVIETREITELAKNLGWVVQ